MRFTPIVRAAATIGFAVAPCSLGFVIIAVSEQLIRSIMVGDDPEMLVSDLQNQFPNDALELADHAYLIETRCIVMGGPTTIIACDDAVRRAYLGY